MLVDHAVKYSDTKVKLSVIIYNVDHEVLVASDGVILAVGLALSEVGWSYLAASRRL